MAQAADLERLREWMRAHGAPPTPLGHETMSTGSESLDELLPGGGFPRGAITVIVGAEGTGRMTVAARAIAKETAERRPAAWVDGQSTLYPPALDLLGVDLDRTLLVRTDDKAKATAALEQIIASAAFRVVVASGIDQALTPVRARRIQTASEAAGACTILVLSDPSRATNAALRLRTSRRSDRLQIDLERSKKGPPVGRAIVHARTAP
jgi:hypothetical protein